MLDHSVTQSSDNLSTPYGRLVAKMAQEHRLLAVHWEMTYRCNHTCTHCYLDVVPPYPPIADELITAEAKDIVDQIAAMGALYLTFSGGEILVRRDFFPIAEYARSKRLAIRLMTNGTLISPLVVGHIADLHPLSVEISLYGADAKTHEAITQCPHSFELTLRAFRLLRERGVRTIMKTPLMRENFRQLADLRVLAASVGATFYYDPTITAKDNGGTEPLKHRLTNEEWISWLRTEIGTSDSIGLRPIEPTQHPCNSGLSSLVIDPYGNVFPCVQMRIAAGNMRTQSLKSIWNNSPVFRVMSALTWSKLPVCGACELKLVCKRCHGIALVETGDFFAPSQTSCSEALARRFVLIEKGILPSDFPIPAHLK
ncbi:MAG: radical SAM protein [Chloroflexi bacterium]|nr:radical SAM protein [Chloroflexota bacterium]